MSEPRTEIEKSTQKTLLDVLAKYKKTIDALLPNKIDPQRFAYLAVSSIRQNPALAGVSPASFINSVILAGQMGLEIRRDSAYLIPFGKECQLLIDYKGKLELARRSKQVGGIQAVTVRENDDFRWQYGANGVDFHHSPAPAGRKIASEDERGGIVGVYAFAQIVPNGMQFREPMSLYELDRIRKQSRSGANFVTLDEVFAAHKLIEDGTKAVWQTWEYKDKRRTPWVTHTEQMFLKTVLHSLCKGLPLTPEAQKSQEVDEGFETGKQPNPFAEAIDIDPVDDKPMIEPTDKQGLAVVKKERVEKASAALAETLEDRDAFPDPMSVPKGTFIRVNGKLWKSNDEQTAWHEYKGEASK